LNLPCRVSVYIFTRFSVVTEAAGFALLGDRFHRGAGFLPRSLRKRLSNLRKPVGLDAKRRFLFAESRMSQRMAFFEAVTLPSLAHQADRGFTHAVFHSPDLPEPWLSRLHGLAEANGLVLLPVGPTDSIGAAARDHIEADLAEHPADRIVTLRLDDDDALCRDFVALVRHYAALSDGELVISFPAGYNIVFPASGHPRVTPEFSLFNAFGLALVAPAAAPVRTIWDCGKHKKIAQSFRTLILPDTRAYVCTSHVHNDSNRFSDKLRNRDSLPDISPTLREQFGLDLSRL
jgi:hypothetical protein